MKVILDTNIYVNDFKMQSANFELLFKYSKEIPIELYLPEIVYDEVINKYKEKLKEELYLFEKTKNTINRYLITSYIAESINIEESINAYKKYFESIIEKQKIKLLKYPKINHKEIVQSIFNKEKPIKENGSGYRDKLILETLKESFKLPEETIVFISNNKIDFGEEPNFYEVISSQFKNSRNWKIKNSLQSFIEEYIAPLMLKNIVSIDENTKNIISNYILSKEFADEFYHSDIAYDIVGLEYNYGTVMLHKIDSIKSVDVLNSEVLGKKLLYTVKISGNFIIYVSGTTPDFIKSESWREYFDYSHEEGFCDISTWTKENITLTFDIIIEDNKVKNIAFKELKTMWDLFTYDW